jgi:hypothetical protein
MVDRASRQRTAAVVTLLAAGALLWRASSAANEAHALDLSARRADARPAVNSPLPIPPIRSSIPGGETVAQRAGPAGAIRGLARTSIRIFGSAEIPLFDSPERMAGRAHGPGGGDGTHAPSYLVAAAAFGDGRERVRRIFLHAVAGMCVARMHAALLVDAVASHPSFWESMLSGADESPAALAAVGGDGAWANGGGRWPARGGSGFELGCAARPTAVQVAVRHHAPAVADLLTRQHQPTFWANALRFDWFLYVEDDLGWDARAVLAVEAELRRLDRLVGATRMPGPFSPTAELARIGPMQTMGGLAGRLFGASVLPLPAAQVGKAAGKAEAEALVQAALDEETESGGADDEEAGDDDDQAPRTRAQAAPVASAATGAPLETPPPLLAGLAARFVSTPREALPPPPDASTSGAGRAPASDAADDDDADDGSTADGFDGDDAARDDADAAALRLRERRRRLVDSAVDWTVPPLAAALPDGDESAMPGLRAAAAGVWTGFVRWEALETAPHLNRPENRTGGLATMNNVPLSQVAPNDFNWKPAGAVAVSNMRRVLLGGEYYIQPINPFSASYALPRPLLARAWARGLPDHPRTKKRLLKEYYGGYWLFSSHFYRSWHASLLKLVPCARVEALLAMHISDSKYTNGDGAQYSTVRSMEGFMRRACGEKAGSVTFGSAEWFKVVGELTSDNVK